MKAGLNLITVLLALIVSTGFSQQIQYKESSLDAGLEQVVVASDLMGGGVAVFDYNRDGWQDLFLISGIQKSKLFKNLGGGVFVDATEEAGGFLRTGSIRTMGVVTADLDNDSYPEILISTGRDLPNIVYKNNGNGTFTEITNESGLRTTKFTIPIVVGDYNLDGLLDVYMINYIEKPRSVFDSQGNVIGFNHTCYPNEFFVNNGSLQFTEKGQELGVADKGCGLAGIFSDVDGDYLPDLYIANDFGQWTSWPNAFLKNNGTSFTSVGAVTGTDAGIYGMGVAQGDIDNDGLLDLFITNMGRNVLYRNKGDGTFADVTDLAKVGNDTTSAGLYNVGWGTAFTDPDNDGHEDLFVSYGYVPGSKIIETSWSSPDKFYKNSGIMPFEDVSAEIQLNDLDLSRGMAIGDFDNDGDEDLVATKLIVTSSGKKPNVMYYLNESDNSNSWLQVSLEGVNANRDGLGSTIKVYSEDLIKVEALSGGSSHASQNSNVLHVGLGQKTLIDSVEIYWPGGHRQVFKTVPINKHIFIKEDMESVQVLGCTDTDASNYMPDATINYGCYYKVPGCTNPTFENYNPSANFNDGSCRNSLITSTEDDLFESVAVYPNPFDDKINIDFITSGPATLRLFDSRGTLVNSIQVSQGDISWYPGVPSGLYLYTLTRPGKKTVTGKLLKK